MKMKYQQGSTLIIVLIVLLLVTIIGTIAIRTSIFNLRLASSNQINNLLLKSSDTALLSLENPDLVEERMTAVGMYGYFLLPGNEDHELTFCFDSNQNDLFSLSKASIINSGRLGVEGYCKKNTFSTGRKAVITQVYLKKLDTAQASPFSNSPTGVGLGTGNFLNLKKNLMSATVISILPAFSGITEAQLNECFRKTSNPNVSDNVAACFRDNGVPYNIQYSEYAVGNG